MLRGGLFCGTLTDARRQRNKYYMRALCSNGVVVGAECKLVVLIKFSMLNAGVCTLHDFRRTSSTYTTT